MVIFRTTTANTTTSSTNTATPIDNTATDATSNATTATPIDKTVTDATSSATKPTPKDNTATDATANATTAAAAKATTTPEKTDKSNAPMVTPESSSAKMPISRGEQEKKDSKMWTFDAVEERLMDVYFDEIDEYARMKFVDAIDDADDQIRELMDADDTVDKEWNELSDEAKLILRSPISEKTKKIYDRYLALYIEHCRVGYLKMWSEPSVIDFFLAVKTRFSKGSLWSIYSCLNNAFQTHRRTRLQTFTRLKVIMKRITAGHVPKKSATFNLKDMTSILEGLDDENPKELLAKVGISLMYYGMLRKGEVMKLTVKDVEMTPDGNFIVRFPYATKNRDAGFEYLLPNNLLPSFKKYVRQIDEQWKTGDLSSRFLKNFNVNSKRRTQNMGIKQISKWIVMSCKLLNKDIEMYSTHTFRRSAATVLADKNVSITNLKRHGRWNSDAVAEGYIDNSRAMKAEKLNLLSGVDDNENEATKRGNPDTPSSASDPSPRQELVPTVASSSSIIQTPSQAWGGGVSFLGSARTVVYSNCNFVAGEHIEVKAAAPKMAEEGWLAETITKLEEIERKAAEAGKKLKASDYKFRDDDGNGGQI